MVTAPESAFRKGYDMVLNGWKWVAARSVFTVRMSKARCLTR